MRKKIAVYVLVIAAGILLGSIYALFFGESGLSSSRRRATSSSISNARSDSGEAEASVEGTQESFAEQVPEAGEEMPAGNAESHLVFAIGSDEYAASVLPQNVLDAMNAINAGESLATVTGTEELEGYFALTTTHMIIARDEETQEVATGSGRLILYVPNLVEGLKDVSVLFYDCEEEAWRVIPADTVDSAGKRVSVMLSGSGVTTTIHRVE